MGSTDEPETSPPSTSKEDRYFAQNGSGEPGNKSGDPLRAGVTPASSDAYYKAKLRAGFIDLRNSYNEKIRPRNRDGQQNYQGSRATHHGGLGFHRSGGLGLGRLQEDAGNENTRRAGRRLPGERTPRRGLYRSNSSLELESLQDEERAGVGIYNNITGLAGAPLRRDYGSASSLDVIGVREDTQQNFLSALQDYRNENLLTLTSHSGGHGGGHSVHHQGHSKLGHHQGQGHHMSHLGQGQCQAAPQPMREFRTGRPEQLQPDTAAHSVAPSSHTDKLLLPNGGAPTGLHAEHDDVDAGGPLSPRLKKSQKHKSKKERNKSNVAETSGGIFKKLRGKSDDSNNSSKSLESPDDLDPSIKTNDRQKRKALVHYDCQSIGVSLYDVIRRRNSLDRRKNKRTGASAASSSPVVEGVIGEGGLPGPPSSTMHSHTPAGGVPPTHMQHDDQGDGRNSDLVLSCPHFRNEIGGEEERAICLNRATAQRRVQQLLGKEPLKIFTHLERPLRLKKVPKY